MTDPVYTPDHNRYTGGMQYRRCGHSGVLLPAVSLGLWQNFGDTAPLSHSRQLLHYAFDHGITHFDLANNYGPPYGSAEETFGRVMKSSFAPYRDEIFITTKAGYDMWPGPYGDHGSRKYLMASLDQSLRRLGLEYVDCFYIHRYDPDTPLEETLQALVDMVRAGKALYVGISRWPDVALRFGLGYLQQRDCHCLVYQDKLNILSHDSLRQLDTVSAAGTGFAAFSPLAEGVLTDRYLDGRIPAGSRAAKGGHLKASDITPGLLSRLRVLAEIAAQRGQTLAQMALSWVLSHPGVTTVLVGASSTAQLADNLRAVKNASFSDDEMRKIADI